MDELKPLLKVNDTFASYEELRRAIERYEKANRVQFWTRDAKKLHRASASVYQIVKDYPELEYCSLRLTCIHGGKAFQRKESPSTKRKSRGTWKQDCKAEIFVKLNEEKNRLVIDRIKEKHNHVIPSAEVFKQFPKARRISGKRRVAQKCLAESKLQERETGISLENIVKVNSLARSNNFRKLSNLLEEKYSCTVDLQTDAEDKVYGFFFQDQLMKKHFQLFPEILAIDGTYTLLNLRCSIYTFSVENSLGSSNIVGVGVLTAEDVQSLNWLLDSFKSRNPKWPETSVVMTERQTSGHKIVSSHFPKARRIMCPLYAAYTFRRDVTQIGRNSITHSEIEECCGFFNELINAGSEEEYNSVVEDMEDTVPYVLTSYYRDKWENLKREWVKAFGATIRDYLKIRLEDPNSKLRSTICSCKTFSIFIEKLFLSLYLRRSQFQNEIMKTLKQFTSHDPTPAELEYQKILTYYAMDRIKPCLTAVADKFQFKTEDCDTVCEAGDQSFVVSEYSCVCDFFILMKLPCEHILVYRKNQNLNLFDECLFSQRWTRRYAQTLFSDEKVQVKVDEGKSVEEKFTEAESVCFRLATLCSEVETSEFEERMALLMQVKRGWENKDQVVLQTVEYVQMEVDST